MRGLTRSLQRKRIRMVQSIEIGRIRSIRGSIQAPPLHVTDPALSVNQFTASVPHKVKPPPPFRLVIAQTSAARVDFIKSLTVKGSAQSAFAIAEILCHSPNHGVTERLERADIYAACLQLSALDDYDVWCDGRHVSSRAIPMGAVHICDMRHSWQADIRSPFHVANFCIPHAALDEFTEEQSAPHVEELRCAIDAGHVDPVFNNLVRALLPALAAPHQTNKLFVEHISRAVTTHLINAYGSICLAPRYGRGGLAPWQERRAKEVLIASLSGDISLSELAATCGLSPGHFSHAFKQTVGLPPHQWLLLQRVERAKQLLLNTSQPLCEIALEAGFADQSHFTRVFSQRTKISPAAWRRAQRR